MKRRITVLVTGNAAGELAPNFILFTGKSLPDNAAKMAPPEFSFGFSDNGWMTAKSYYEYVGNVFVPWLDKKKIQRPVILYIDGHSSHLTLHLSKLCSSNGIVLIKLHPNATHIMQPLDVSVFQALKIEWQKAYQNYCEKSLTIGIHKYQFAPVLKKAIDCMNLKKILPNGFKKCGLFPFNADAVDYSKVLCLCLRTT